VRYDRNGEGLIRGYTAPNGKTYRSQRDAAGRVVGNTDLLGKTYGYGYDEVGNLVARTNAAGQVTRFEHDALRRVTKVTGHDGTTERFEYDALGNLTRAYCADGSCDIRLEYDRLNRLTARRVLAPYRRSLTYTYDGMGKRLTVTDSDGIVTAYTYDLYNRPTSVSNRLTGEFRFVYQPQFELAPVRNLEFIFYPNGC
jgi:YD repeat-containing protein